MIYIFFFCCIFCLSLLFFLNSELEEKEKEIIELKRPLIKHVQVIPHNVTPIDYCYHFEIPEHEFIHWRQFLKKNDDELIDRHIEQGIYKIAEEIKKQSCFKFRRNERPSYLYGEYNYQYEIQIQVIPQIF